MKPGHASTVVPRSLYVLYIVICDVILSPSCTVRCPGATESLVLLSSNSIYILPSLVHTVARIQLRPCFALRHWRFLTAVHLGSVCICLSCPHSLHPSILCDISTCHPLHRFFPRYPRFPFSFCFNDVYDENRRVISVGFAS